VHKDIGNGKKYIGFSCQDRFELEVDRLLQCWRWIATFLIKGLQIRVPKKTLVYIFILLKLDNEPSYI